MAYDEIPSPSRISSAMNGAIHTLSGRINSSTRSSHTQLNRLIIARLPLALPPYTSNPSTYAFGLLHIAPIYITFESLWRSILEAPCPLKTPGSGARKVRNRTNSILSHLHLPGLLRSGPLRADIKTLLGMSDLETEEQLRMISQNGKISEFIQHTTISVNAKPHVLLAYAWVMYMALFSGGRYIRASLREAGSEFWARSPSDALDPPERRNSRSESEGLEFFHFLGEEDGEDIKREFKKRFAEVEILLSEGEKDDIVQEAQHIFSFMVEMIGELDRICGSSDLNVDQAKERDDFVHEPGIRAASPMFSFNNILSVAFLEALRKRVRKIITPLARFSSKADFSKTQRHDPEMICIFRSSIDGLDAAFVISAVLFILALALWHFALF